MTAPVALSCGDPAGIGPELAVRAWDRLRADCPFLWIGDPAHLPAGTAVALIDDASEAAGACARALPVLVQDFAAPALPGQPDPANAAGVIAAIERAVALVMAGDAAAVCTAPIAKKVLIDGAGFAHPGHTEFLAALAGVDRVVMMLASARLRVVPATVHIALAQVPRVLTPELLRETIEITARGMRERFAIPRPRIAVAGLNPHAGEGGVMGREEAEWIAPLVFPARETRSEGSLVAQCLVRRAVFRRSYPARR